MRVVPSPSVWGDGRRGRIGLLGGSFNPAHEGHRHISLCALAALALDEVWWLVSPQNPLKAAQGMAPLALRVAWAQSVARHPRIRVTALETAFPDSYTAHSLRRLRQRFRRVSFVWLMGADNLRQIDRWRQWKRIFLSVPVAVCDRGLDHSAFSGQAITARAASVFSAARCPRRRAARLAQQTPPSWVFLPIRRHPASATALRMARQLPVGWPLGGAAGEGERPV